MRILLGIWTTVSVTAICATVAGEPYSAAQLEFFETRIRPVLVEQCYACHNSAKKSEGGLALDDRASLLRGGDENLVIVPGKPAESRLLPILRHEVKGLNMPRNGGKLDARVIADFEKWIADGAADPRDKPPTAEELNRATSWDAVLEKRKKWWSFQPIKNPPAPEIPGLASAHPIDRFIQAKLQEKGLAANGPADARTRVRRAYFAVIGLPPTPEEVERWSARLDAPHGFEELVDQLLASPHFGEKWARHWMDWIRYAESHGSEGDPAIENAWLYRDYLIRALNADVSFDQLLREHIAGDLLENPRIDKTLKINESLIGPAHWRMVFHGFAPTDALEEKVRFVDDEINTFTKAFLGLTVSCARCHDHKFDPVSQKDYYALFGILGSCRPGRTAIDTPEILTANRTKLAALKPQIRAAAANVWRESLKSLGKRLAAADGPWTKADKPKDVLQPLFQLHQFTVSGKPFNEAWQGQLNAQTIDGQYRAVNAERPYLRFWNLALNKDYSTWFRQGVGLPEHPLPAGEFALQPSGPDVFAGIYPAGIYSHLYSAKNPARLSSGLVHLNGKYEVYWHIIGGGRAAARYVVQDYPRNGSIYPETKAPKDWQWQKLDASYWDGDDIHLELTTDKDAPVLVGAEPRSWFGIREAVVVKKGDPVPSDGSREFLGPVFEVAEHTPPKSLDDVANCYIRALGEAINAWQSGRATDGQALLLDACLHQGLLPNSLTALASVQPLVAEYRRLEEEIVVPTRVPALEEAGARNQRLLIRGNHKSPGDEVPRHFLEAIDATPYKTEQSGRRELAEDLLREDNPLTRRVIVNRLWHHLFGRGIVPTPDNFGKLGQEPTHPELLDYLATRFKAHNGSLKDTIRFILTSQTWQASSRPTPQAQQSDPDNLLLSHAFVRRLEAEDIRDSLLYVSGKLSPDLYGSPVNGESVRRSVYVGVRRNALDPFLRAFDFPEPFSTVGRRDSTNVPAQSLTMMNDEHVASLASAWAAKLLAANPNASDDERIREMFLTAFARPAQDTEIARFKDYLKESGNRRAELSAQFSSLHKQLDEHTAVVRALTDPVRARLTPDTNTTDAKSPQPIHRWEFKESLQDVVGNAHGIAHQGAHIESGALVCDLKSYVLTAPLPEALKEKTLEAWVQLNSLEQRGGGVMTVQSRTGNLFDAIVFGEKEPRMWMAGSNGYSRFQSFHGPAEHDALARPVQLALAFHADGRICAYRDGQPYGTAYKSGVPLEFKPSEAVVGFGIRHTGGGSAQLSGRILRAQLFNRALSDEEVRATFEATPGFVSEEKVLAELNATDRAKVNDEKQRIAELNAQIEKLGPVPEPLGAQALWTDAARALFTFKEFIYLK